MKLLVKLLIYNTVKSANVMEQFDDEFDFYGKIAKV